MLKPATQKFSLRSKPQQVFDAATAYPITFKMTKTRRGKRSPLSQAQRNMRKALVWSIRVFAHYDKEKQELVNTCTESDNHAILNTFFTHSDTAVFPPYAFDGCVLRDKKGTGALQIIQKEQNKHDK